MAARSGKGEAGHTHVAGGATICRDGRQSGTLAAALVEIAFGVQRQLCQQLTAAPAGGQHAPPCFLIAQAELFKKHQSPCIHQPDVGHVQNVFAIAIVLFGRR